MAETPTPHVASTQEFLRGLVVPSAAIAILGLAMAHYHRLLREVPPEAITPLQENFGYLLEVGVWLAFALLIHRVFNRVVWDGIFSRAFDGPTPKLLKDLSGTLIFFLALTAIVGLVFDQPVTGLWATSSAIGLVTGFALKSVILDVFIGLATNIDQPYRIGDWVQVHTGRPDPANDLYGQVLEVKWRTTRILTRDRRVVVVPNSVIGDSTITNFNLPTSLNRHTLSYYLDPWVDPDRAANLLVAGARQGIHDGVLVADPAPRVYAKGTNREGARYDLEVYYDVDAVLPCDAADAASRGVTRSLHAAGLTPSVGRSVFFDNPPRPAQLDPRRPEDRRKLLADVPLLASLDADERAQLSGAESLVHLEADEVLIQRGDPGNSMYVLVEGLLRVHIPVGEDGEEVVRPIRPGSYLGELSLLTGDPRSATVDAELPSTLIEIRQGDLQPLLMARPELAERLAQDVARLQVQDERARSEHAARQDQRAQHEERTQGLLEQMKDIFKGVFSGR